MAARCVVLRGCDVPNFRARWSIVLMWVHELDRLAKVMLDLLSPKYATKVHLDIGEAGLEWLKFAEFDVDEFHQLLAWEMSMLNEEISASVVVGGPQDNAGPSVFWFDLWWVGDEDN